MCAVEAIPSSFRDPSGFLFSENGTLYRQVGHNYKAHYDRLMESGLYQSLVEEGLLIPHKEVMLSPSREGAYKILQPEVIPFISYPYEWCFSQLKQAAQLTLRVQQRALDHGMTLKDSSAYNVQFRNGKPTLIDTLSFETYQEGKPWLAYRQFCQQFLAPLALMSHRDVRLNQLLRVYIDGVPLDLASSLLPLHTRLLPSLLTHIHLHAKAQKHFEDKPVKVKKPRMGKVALLGLLDSLKSTVKSLAWRLQGTEWADYYAETNYSASATEHKKQLVAQFLDEIQPPPKSGWDLGANVGLFSRIASQRGILTISFDIDPACVEKNYLECVQKGETRILPLLLDLTNPSPNLGWENQERTSFLERGPTDVAVALALIHHLAISNNLPLPRIAHFFSKICRWLIIEFVPKEDSQVQRLLSTREDIFVNYTQRAFEDTFRRHFTCVQSTQVSGTERTLYLMKRN